MARNAEVSSPSKCRMAACTASFPAISKRRRCTWAFGVTVEIVSMRKGVGGEIGRGRVDGTMRGEEGPTGEENARGSATVATRTARAL